MSGTSIRKQALKEMAKEKAQFYGKKSTSFGSFQEILRRMKLKLKNFPPKKEFQRFLPQPKKFLLKNPLPVNSILIEFLLHQLSPGSNTAPGEKLKRKKNQDMSTQLLSGVLLRR